jgi:rare lipoprotein A
MERADLPQLLQRYPIVEGGSGAYASSLNQQDLLNLAQKLDTMLAKEDHEISFYGEEFHGDGTAFGETFDMQAMTAAHRTFPWNTLVKVTNVENGKSVIVRVNDRGPYVEGRDMDLSEAAFLKIAESSSGIARATFQRLGDQVLVDTCTQAVQRFQKRITKDVRFHRGIPHDSSVHNTLDLAANRSFVIRSIRYPDGTTVRLQDWVSPEEHFSFIPAQEGEYVFLVGTTNGRQREMQMSVHSCETP